MKLIALEVNGIEIVYQFAVNVLELMLDQEEVAKKL